MPSALSGLLCAAHVRAYTRTSAHACSHMTRAYTCAFIQHVRPEQDARFLPQDADTRSHTNAQIGTCIHTHTPTIP